MYLRVLGSVIWSLESRCLDKVKKHISWKRWKHAWDQKYTPLRMVLWKTALWALYLPVSNSWRIRHLICHSWGGQANSKRHKPLLYWKREISGGSVIPFCIFMLLGKNNTIRLGFHRVRDFGSGRFLLA